MPDYYQALMAAMPQQQQSPQPLWDGIDQAAQVPNGDLLAMMRAKQAQQKDRLYMRELNPGVTWGGRDKNAIQPDDVMQTNSLPPSPENI